MKNKPLDIQVKVSDEVLKGTYSNNAMIVHSRGEFMIDFMTILPPKGVLGARIIMSPNNAKRLAQALQDNVRMFEASFGEIKETEEPELKIVPN